ncbi:ABC transporter permease [Haloechinothrix sp. LS1_15]|uniref:ABC transporter permease n=1 Tax=Haloechinothrix sp. LS1_15 TaxID=2652248 RepID=UPI0029454EB7|nr:ABC transporter permease [Haloechinothrix sp. LS1_15]MDV6012497.1 ABC transporter permease [Haloechinothrix sp. LS1_15]
MSSQAAAATHRSSVPHRPRPLTGTGTLIRFILRRDRVRIPVWMGAITIAMLGTVLSYADTFATQEDRDQRAELAASPVFQAFNGPGYGLDHYTFGALVAYEGLYLAVILVSLMSIFLTVRHTRAEEEAGRAELVRAAVVGRHASTAAVLIVVAAVNIVVGLLTAAGLSTMDDLDGTGSLTFGASMIAASLVFTAVALVAAQLTEYARGAVGMSVATLGATYVLRAAGDVSETDLSWLSPFAWSLETRTFVDERWWPLLLSLALAVGLTVGAMALSTRRDVGAGLVPPRPGKPNASDRLIRPYGLALRLQAGSLVAWATGLLLLGASFGSLLGDIEAFAAENEQAREIIATAEGGTVLESFLGTLTLMLALIATACAIQSIVRLRHEEVAGRAEPLLATSLPRTRWVGGYLGVSLIGSAFVMLAGSAGLGVTGAINQADVSLLFTQLAAGLVYVPAIWVAVGIALVLYGWAPRAVPAVWLVLAYGVVVFLLADAMGLPEGARNLSPFHHMPELPGADFTATPVLASLALVAASVAVGIARFRSRDVHTSA